MTGTGESNRPGVRPENRLLGPVLTRPRDRTHSVRVRVARMYRQGERKVREHPWPSGVMKTSWKMALREICDMELVILDRIVLHRFKYSATVPCAQGLEYILREKLEVPYALHLHITLIRHCGY